MLPLPTLALFLPQLKTVLIWLAVAGLVALLIVRNIRIVPEQTGLVIERLGSFHTTWLAGLHVKIPLIDRVAKEVSLKDKLITLPPLATLTHDRVPLHVDLTVHYRISDLKAYTYGAENPLLALEELASSRLRQLVGDMTLEQALSTRQRLNAAVQAILEETAQGWGLAVFQVALNNLVPPVSVQEALDQARQAEQAEQAKDLQAQADEKALVRQAKAEHQAALIRAEAQQQLALQEAKSKAQAWLIELEATAQAVASMQAAGDDRRWVTVTGLKALVRLAENQAHSRANLSDLRALLDLLRDPDDADSQTSGRGFF